MKLKVKTWIRVYIDSNYHRLLQEVTETDKTFTITTTPKFFRNIGCYFIKTYPSAIEAFIPPGSNINLDLIGKTILTDLLYTEGHYCDPRSLSDPQIADILKLVE